MKALYKNIIIIGAGIGAIAVVYYYVFSPKRIINQNPDTNVRQIIVEDVLPTGDAHVTISYTNGQMDVQSIMTGNDLSSLKALGVPVIYRKRA